MPSPMVMVWALAIKAMAKEAIRNSFFMTFINFEDSNGAKVHKSFESPFQDSKNDFGHIPEAYIIIGVHY